MIAGVVGALVAAISLVSVYQLHPAIRLEMDRALPRIATGLYAPEINSEANFAWSGGRVQISVPEVDRRVPWICRAAVINWRPASAGPAFVRVESDGNTLVAQRVTAPRETLTFPIQPHPDRSELRVDMAVSPTFRPGSGDTRDLGVAFDWIRCEPEPGRWALPSASVVVRGAVAAAAIGVAVGLVGLPVTAAVGVSVATAGIQAAALATGAAPYSPGTPPVFVLAALFICFCLVPVLFIETVLRRSLCVSARLAIVVSACACYVKLLFLLHPDKLLVDGLFHAHRFEWVLAGRYYFTQLSTSATPFPYAIGLYMFAAPWSVLTHDHVALLKIVVCVSEAAAGVLLYAMIVRAWGDRVTGVLAVALFHLVPLPYVVVGNENLTNAFGQSAAFVTMATATMWTLRPGQIGQMAGLTLLATLAFLSHVGTFAVLLPMLLVAAALYYWLGGAALSGPARSLILATTMAVVLSAGLYYGHFGQVYRPQLVRVRDWAVTLLGATRAPDTPGGTPIVAPPAAAPAAAPADPRVTTLQLGATGAFAQTRANIGWPILILAIVGAWRVWVRRVPDRLVLAVVAWCVTGLAFLVLSIVRPVDVRYQQDAWEFLGRVELAIYPAAVVLAACGAVWAWRAGIVHRVASGLLLMAALVTGARALNGWIH